MHIVPKYLHEYAGTRSLKHPQFCCLGRQCFGKYPQWSPYLQQVLNNKSFLLPLFDWVVSFGSTSTKRQTQLSDNNMIETKVRLPSSNHTSLCTSKIQWLDRHRIDILIQKGRNQKEERSDRSQASPKCNRANPIRTQDSRVINPLWLNDLSPRSTGVESLPSEYMGAENLTL